MNTDASILVYKFRPKRTGYNMYAEYTLPQFGSSNHIFSEYLEENFARLTRTEFDSILKHANTETPLHFIFSKYKRQIKFKIKSCTFSIITYLIKDLLRKKIMSIINF